MARHTFACAARRCLLDGIPGLRLPGSAVSPRFSPLRTSRRPGGDAVTSAPEGRALHPHGTLSYKALRFAVYPRTASSFDQRVTLGEKSRNTASERVPRSSPLHLCQRRLGLRQPAHPRDGTCGVAGVESTPHTLPGSGGIRLGAVPQRHVLLVRVLRRLRLPQGRVACVGHSGVIRPQIPAVTRLTKGHPDGA